MILRIAGLVAIAAAVAVPADVPPQQLIASIQQRVIANFQRPANCLCRETVEGAAAAPIESPVALIDGREQYTWPGAKGKPDAVLNGLSNDGTLNHGAYAGHPRNLFLKRGAKFAYKGQETVEGRKLVRFDFAIPGEGSTFTLTDGKVRFAVGYHGSLWADAATFNLVRLEAAADDIPASSGIKASEDRITYQQVDLGGDTFTLPQRVERKLVTAKGTVQSVSTISACHPFSVEMLAGVVNKDDDDDKDEPKPVEQQVVSSSGTRTVVASPTPQRAVTPRPVAEPLKANVTVPAGLRLDMALVTPISSVKGARVGDPIKAVLVNTLESEGKIYIHANAEITGVITSMERQTFQMFDFYIFSMRWDWIREGDSRAAFSADLEEVPIATEGYVFLPYHHVQAQDVTAWNRIHVQLHPPKYNEGSFWMRGSTLHLGSGMRFVWKTTRPPQNP